MCALHRGKRINNWHNRFCWTSIHTIAQIVSNAPVFESFEAIQVIMKRSWFSGLIALNCCDRLSIKQGDSENQTKTKLGWIFGQQLLTKQCCWWTWNWFSKRNGFWRLTRLFFRCPVCPSKNKTAGSFRALILIDYTCRVTQKAGPWEGADNRDKLRLKRSSSNCLLDTLVNPLILKSD